MKQKGKIEMPKILVLLALSFIVTVTALNAQDKSSEKEIKPSAPQDSKKTNQRPNVKSSKTAPTEPFEKADVKTMAAQCVKIETEAGAIELELFPESAPESVRNFLNLTAIGAFDTTTFSRVVPGFVIQGGSISTREKLTPELSQRAQKTIPDEPNPIKHERGMLSMARSGEPNSASSSFFILVGSGSHLDGTFAAFGRVTLGMEVVDAISKMPVENEQPKNPVRIKQATVTPCQAQANP
jgi:peptidyl-prolyl cis-trans isomerase B (cyclophilin B)